MNTNKDIQEELTELAPFLSKIPKQQPNEQFAVPSDYFDKLSSAIFEQTIDKEETVIIQEAEPQPSWLDQIIWTLQALLQPKYAIAFATVLLLAVTGVFLLQPASNADDLTLAEIDTYIEENIDQFDEDLLVEFVPTDTETTLDMEASELEEYIEDNILEDLDEETLEELL